MKDTTAYMNIKKIIIIIFNRLLTPWPANEYQESIETTELIVSKSENEMVMKTFVNNKNILF